tara:strand:+ start:597 stop:1124 length:528 start_codon:yes stop_codon:yes gene_type:complete
MSHTIIADTSLKKEVIEYNIGKSIELDKFIYIDANYNLNVCIRYFYKLKNYEHVISYIFNTIDRIIELRNEKLNTILIEAYIDLNQYKIKELDFDFIKIMVHICQEKYPDNLNIIYIKNANIMVKSIYAIIRPFIDKDTRKKIFFIKKNKNLDKNKNTDKNKKVNENNLDELFDI